ncbi:MAG: hypothetical protein LPH21_17695 [Shewanella sp.]|nr:hypothetical protein [Shewanella sp.]
MMEITTKELLIALISGVFVIAAPVVTMLISRYLDNKKKPKISGSRSESLVGIWEGIVSQANEGYRLGAKLNLSVKKNTVVGDLTLSQNEDEEAFFGECLVEGVVFNDRYLRINYTSKNRREVQFGSCLLELDDQGKNLLGSFLGYGKMSRKIVTGEVSLSKRD